VNVRINEAGENVQAGGVNLLVCSAGEFGFDSDDFLIRHADIRPSFPILGNDCSTAQNQIQFIHQQSVSRLIVLPSIIRLTRCCGPPGIKAEQLMAE
jgi:hypothetical protein